MFRVKKNDQVMVVAGKDKGKQGKILHLFPKQQKAIVENINMVKKARRRTQQDQQGGIIEIENPIHLSNLMPYCKQCNKATRIKVGVLNDGSKIRECQKCGAAI